MTWTERDNIEEWLRNEAKEYDILDCVFCEQNILEALISEFQDNPKYRKIYDKHVNNDE